MVKKLVKPVFIQSHNFGALLNKFQKVANEINISPLPNLDLKDHINWFVSKINNILTSMPQLKQELEKYKTNPLKAMNALNKIYSFVKEAYIRQECDGYSYNTIQYVIYWIQVLVLTPYTINLTSIIKHTKAHKKYVIAHTKARELIKTILKHIYVMSLGPVLGARFARGVSLILTYRDIMINGHEICLNIMPEIQA